MLEILPVSQGNFKDLPDFRLFPYSCKYCVYWESMGDFDEKIDKITAEKIKRDWFRRVSEKFGNCGFIAYLEDVSVGYAQHAPLSLCPKLLNINLVRPLKMRFFLRAFTFLKENCVEEVLADICLIKCWQT